MTITTIMDETFNSPDVSKCPKQLNNQNLHPQRTSSTGQNHKSHRGHRIGNAVEVREKGYVYIAHQFTSSLALPPYQRRSDKHLCDNLRARNKG